MFGEPVVGELEAGLQLVGMQNGWAVVEDSRALIKEVKEQMDYYICNQWQTGWMSHKEHQMIQQSAMECISEGLDTGLVLLQENSQPPKHSNRRACFSQRQLVSACCVHRSYYWALRKNDQLGFVDHMLSHWGRLQTPELHEPSPFLLPPSRAGEQKC